MVSLRLSWPWFSSPVSVQCLQIKMQPFHVPIIFKVKQKTEPCVK